MVLLVASSLLIDQVREVKPRLASPVEPEASMSMLVHSPMLAEVEMDTVGTRGSSGASVVTVPDSE